MEKLFDFKFDHLISKTVVKILYVTSVALMTIAFIVLTFLFVIKGFWLVMLHFQLFFRELCFRFVFLLRIGLLGSKWSKMLKKFEQNSLSGFDEVRAK